MDKEEEQHELGMETDFDDLWFSIYDAAKSGHGGRSSLKFRGNSKTTQRSSWGAWGNQRRPHWSRKRRKDYKTDFAYAGPRNPRRRPI